MKKILIFSFVGLCLFTCKSKSDKNTDKTSIESNKEVKTSDQSLTIELNAKNESNVSGKVHFVQTDDVVQMTAMVSLFLGNAIHIHEKSDCSSPDGK